MVLLCVITKEAPFILASVISYEAIAFNSELMLFLSIAFEI